MSLSISDTATIRIHTQAIAFFQQKEIIDALYSEMEEVWLTLHTTDKKCPIVEQVATNVKRKLVQRYAVELIRFVRRTIGFDLITKVVDPDAAYWVADDIVNRLSDNKTENHRGLFNAVLVGVFGISTRVLEFMEKEEPTKEDLYELLRRFYDVKVLDWDLEDKITVEDVTESLSSYITSKKATLFVAEIF